MNTLNANKDENLLKILNTPPEIRTYVDVFRVSLKVHKKNFYN